MKIGYIRVSTVDQNLETQRDTMQRAGCERIFEDTISGGKEDRPGLRGALAALQAGDTLVFWKLDRLTRKTSHALETADYIGKIGAHMQSLTESFDTSVPSGRMMFTMIAAFAEMERAYISERTKAALAQLKANGQKLGRPYRYTTEEINKLVELNRQGIGYKRLSKMTGIPVISIRMLFARIGYTAIGSKTG